MFGKYFLRTIAVLCGLALFIVAVGAGFFALNQNVQAAPQQPPAVVKSVAPAAPAANDCGVQPPDDASDEVKGVYLDCLMSAWATPVPTVSTNNCGAQPDDNADQTVKDAYVACLKLAWGSPTTATVTATTTMSPTMAVNPPGKWLGSSPHLKFKMEPNKTYAINVSMNMPPDKAVAGKGGEVNAYGHLASGIEYMEVLLDGTAYEYNGVLDAESQQCDENANAIYVNTLPGFNNLFVFENPCGTPVTAPYPPIVKHVTWKDGSGIHEWPAAETNNTATDCSLEVPDEVHNDQNITREVQCWVELQYWFPNVDSVLVLFKVPVGQKVTVGPFRGVVVSRPQQPHKSDLPNGMTIVTLEQARAAGVQIPNNVEPYEPLQ